MSPRLLAVVGGTALLLGLGRATAPGPLLALLAALALGLPLGAALRLDSWPRPALLAAASFGFWIAFPHLPEYGPLSFLGALARELAYYAVAPFLLDLLLELSGPRVRDRLGLDPARLYLPLAIVAAVVAGTLLYQHATGHEALGASLRLIATIYGLSYGALIAVALRTRIEEVVPRDGASGPGPGERAADSESTGRFRSAAHLYAQDGNFAKGAEMAERAGDWPRAADFHRRAGNPAAAADCFARAQRWEEAAAMYEAAGDQAALALLCEQQGWTDRAAAAFERRKDFAGAIRVLEKAARQPPAELYEKAGQFARAAAGHLAAGRWRRAAEIMEQHLGDPEGAAGVCAEAGAWGQAARLFEAAKRPEAAIDAYLKAPDGTFEALRLCLDRGDGERARSIAAGLPPALESKAAEDEKTAVLLARLHQQAGRLDDAIRLLQRLKRAGGGSGPALLLLGRCLREKGLHDLAEEELSAAVSLPLDPDVEMEARYEWARALESVGRREAAADVYRALLKQQLDYRDVEARYRQLSAAPAPAAPPGVPTVPPPPGLPGS